MKRYLRLLLLLPLFLLLCLPARAQFENGPYTGSNRIIIALEGPTSRYEFVSQQLLVRYNKNTQQVECMLPVQSLVPLNDSIPANMAYDVLFGARYPQLFINIAAPVEKISSGSLVPETIDRTTSVGLQGVNNETVIPVAFTSENNALFFSTSFDLMLDNFQASLPLEYLPLLTGRVLITIDHARWVNIRSR